jgi:hypothetical protein
MFKKISVTIFFLSVLFPVTAQVTLISEFLWDSNPITAANVGPNGTSVSGSAGSSAGGVGGTNGLNPRACCAKADINLTIPGSPTFDVVGIDVWIDFQREESTGDFVTRGSSLRFGMNGGNLFASFRVDNGMGGFNTVSSGNVYAIPNDDVFRTYRFYYDPVSGVSEIFVNGASVWSNDGPDNRNMYWTGSGNLVVGNLMDGTGANETIFDNLRIYEVTNILLPVEWLFFNASLANNSQSVQLSWGTASEQYNDYFTIERSLDATNWQEVSRVSGAGNSSVVNTYNLLDKNPPCGTLYYRLKQTDFNGEYKFSDIVAVNISCNYSVNIYPNPTANFLTVECISETDFIKEIKLVDITGSVIHFIPTQVNNKTYQLDFSSVSPGIYFVTILLNDGVLTERIILDK